jgi:phenylacetate-CoA ligase
MASANLQSRRSGYSADMDEAERASRDEIIALQTKRLAWTLAHAYDNVAHYKRAFDEAGVHPSDFKQLSDLGKFPFTVKTDLRDNYPFSMFAVPAKNWSASTPLPAPPASRSWSDIRGAISTCGRM